MEMKDLLDEYRQSCNLLTQRIDEINHRLRIRVSQHEYRTLSARRRILREERLDLLRVMRTLQEYCV